MSEVEQPATQQEEDDAPVIAYSRDAREIMDRRRRAEQHKENQ